MDGESSSGCHDEDEDAVEHADAGYDEERQEADEEDEESEETF